MSASNYNILCAQMLFRGVADPTESNAALSKYTERHTRKAIVQQALTDYSRGHIS